MFRRAAAVAPTGEAHRILDITRKAKKDLRLKPVRLRVTVDGREVVTDALGESMTGVPAEPDLHFRAGSVAFAHIGTALLRLVEQRRVRLDDTVERWLPALPKADRITLRMLASNTSGLHDYVTDPAFGKELEANPFRAWTPGSCSRIRSATRSGTSRAPAGATPTATTCS